MEAGKVKKTRVKGPVHGKNFRRKNGVFGAYPLNPPLIGTPMVKILNIKEFLVDPTILSRSKSCVCKRCFGYRAI
jgi:hypothetical protein